MKPTCVDVNKGRQTRRNKKRIVRNRRRFCCVRLRHVISRHVHNKSRGCLSMLLTEWHDVVGKLHTAHTGHNLVRKRGPNCSITSDNNVWRLYVTTVGCFDRWRGAERAERLTAATSWLTTTTAGSKKNKKEKSLERCLTFGDRSGGVGCLGGKDGVCELHPAGKHKTKLEVLHGCSCVPGQRAGPTLEGRC